MSREVIGGQILFTQGAWEIHAEFENPDWVEIFHRCDRYDKVGEKIGSSYQLPNDIHCPGCNAIQPDEIQALEVMHNMDRPARQWGDQFMARMINTEFKAIFDKQWKVMCIKDLK